MLRASCSSIGSFFTHGGCQLLRRAESFDPRSSLPRPHSIPFSHVSGPMDFSRVRGHTDACVSATDFLRTATHTLLVRLRPGSPQQCAALGLRLPPLCAPDASRANLFHPLSELCMRIQKLGISCHGAPRACMLHTLLRRGAQAPAAVFDGDACHHRVRANRVGHAFDS